MRRLRCMEHGSKQLDHTAPQKFDSSSHAATIVVVPREGFRATKRALESITAVTRPGYSMVYVDGGSPGRVRRYLQQRARELNCTLVRTEHYLTPNEARNLGLQYAHTKYVVFIDNDVVVAPGWLDALVACAEETDAWVVGPLYCGGEPVHHIVHMAGGECRIVEENGERVFREKHHYDDMPLARALEQVPRQETNLIEFHCVLVRRDVFDQIGPLDEALLSIPEHSDFCLMVRAAGGSIYLEPKAVVSYLSPSPVAWSDLPFFTLRWSEDWTRDSVEHFRAKWNLSASDAHLEPLSTFMTHHRRLYYKTFHAQPVRTLLLLLGGDSALASFDATIERVMDRLWVQPAERKRAHRRAPTVIYGS